MIAIHIAVRFIAMSVWPLLSGIVIFLAEAQATSGVPDTVAMCLGENACTRCLTMQTAISGNDTPFDFLPSKHSCIDQLQKAGGFQAITDRQMFLYGNKEDIVSSQASGSLSYQYRPPISSSVENGAAAAVLSSMMRQDITAEQAKEVGQRLNNIRNAIILATGRLEASYIKTTNDLPRLDAEIQKRFHEDITHVQGVIDSKGNDLSRVDQAEAPVLPQRPASNPAFGTGGLGEEVLREKIRETIAPEHLRIYGNDIGGVLNRSLDRPNNNRTFLSSAIALERAKIEAAFRSGHLSVQVTQHLEKQLIVIENLVARGNADGHEIAKRALGDVQSARQVAEGKSLLREETILKDDGTLVTQSVSPGNPAAENSLGGILVRLDYAISLGESAAEAAGAQSSAYNGTDREARLNVAALAKQLITGSALAYYAGELVRADTLVDAGLALADLATNWVPQLSVPRSAYELITGRDLFTQEQLSDLELVGRALDIASAGFGGKLLKGYERTLRISQHIYNTERYKRIALATKRFADKAATKGINPKIPFERLYHIRERHLPGGTEVPKVPPGVPVNPNLKHTLFNKEDEVLDLAIEAVGHPSSVSKSRNGATHYLWKRGELAKPIGYDSRRPEIVCKDVLVIIDDAKKEILTTFPWHPGNSWSSY